jgi:death-on-curing protein
VSDWIWLEREEAIAIHEMALAQHGGLAGLREESLLLSALDKPKNKHAYERSDLATLAASYAFGIVRNHPFLDGNKRTGFLLAATFIELNGLAFFASEPAVVENTLALAAGTLSEEKYATWLRENSLPLKP